MPIFSIRLLSKGSMRRSSLPLTQKGSTWTANQHKRLLVPIASANSLTAGTGQLKPKADVSDSRPTSPEIASLILKRWAESSSLLHCDLLDSNITTMHRIWQIPELLVHIISFLPAPDINRAFHVSHLFRTLLKANLPPQFRPLPEAPRCKRSRSNSRLPEDVIAQANAYLAQELATTKQLKCEDSYHFWREAARSQILDTLLPSLHPLFASSETRLMDGYEALAQSRMDICLQTEIPYHNLYKLVHSEAGEGWGEALGVGVKTVTVYCLGGVQWDLLYSGVRYREHRGVKRFSVRLERGKGVRLNDVMDELAGTLVVHSMSGGLGQDVTLVWVFGNTVEEHEMPSGISTLSLGTGLASNNEDHHLR